MNYQAAKYSELIKSEAQAMGFDFCGISKAEKLDEEAPRLEQWLRNGQHGQMGWLANYFDKRLDPTLLVPGAKSVISLLYNYYPQKDLAKPNTYKIAKYAYGQDYHHILRPKLWALFHWIHAHIGEVGGRVFVDSAPVMERAWAAKSGLGWVGKHTLLINKKAGSFFLLAEVIIDLELQPDGPVRDFCGNCTRCIDACPTQAISPYAVDASKCISYLTIELKEQIPPQFAGKMDNWVFGCDICQDVCPWNRLSKPHREPTFEPHPELGQLQKRDWEEMTEDVFRKLFQKSAVKRTKYQGLMRNIRFQAQPPADAQGV